MIRHAGQPITGEGQLWSRGTVRKTLRGDAPTPVEAGIYVVDAHARGRRKRFHAVHVTEGIRTVLLWQFEDATTGAHVQAFTR